MSEQEDQPSDGIHGSGNPDSPAWSEETKLVMVDGRDALAYVIIRPSQTEQDGGNIVVEAQARGISQQQAAYIMRELASRWDPSTTCSCAGPPSS